MAQSMIQEEIQPVSRVATRISVSEPLANDSATQFGREDRDFTRTNSIASGTTAPHQHEKIKTSTAAQASTSTAADIASPPPLPAPTPFQARFWSNDPVTSIKRKLYINILAKSTLVVIVVIFAVLSIFWSSLFNLQSYAYRLEGWVIDFDGGIIGQTVIQSFQNLTGLPQQMTWRVVDASRFPNFPQDVMDAVVDERTWAAVTINPGASTDLSVATVSADSSYNGSRAVTVYANQARNNNGYSTFILPMVNLGLTNAARAFATQNSQELSANGFINVQNLLAQAPNVVTNPLFYTISNLRPFDRPVATAVDYVGLIYLLIISFIVCMMNYQARVTVTGLNEHLKLSSLIALRIFIPFVLYFFVSIFFSLLSLAFQAPFDRFFGHSGFVIYWMMNWMGMCAMGLAMESMITILTPGFIPFFLILWIISNVSVSSLPIEVLPVVFRYGYAVPFYNISQTVRTILFNTRNYIGLNFGVQFAWIGVSLIWMTSFTILMRKYEERAWTRRRADSGAGDSRQGKP